MSTFTVEGEECLRKVVAPHGNGAIVYVPKTWIGRKVVVILESE